MKNNFDFLVGTWDSKQRRLREPLSGSSDWYEFTGQTKSWNVFNGAGNIDEVWFPSLGFGGVTLRLYNQERDEWSLYWASSTTGLAMPPNVGRFDDTGVGTFLCEERYKGTPIVCRYRWSEITGTSARWDQAFSTDGGSTWETNWVADFRRTS
ncbi:hypothetical protein [Micromonospora sp. NPDC003776]